ncbi:hypothetical protein AGMMS49975_16040 [Clostridia bacterium]|nr:hypothetical protein AGMMS49975_16040 [Clostridia bacterium]
MKIFEKEEFGAVSVQLIDSEPWFVGLEVAQTLDYSNYSKAINDHIETCDVTKRYVSSDVISHGKPTGKYKEGEMTLINESGVNSLILSSKLPKAKAVRQR